MIHFYNDIDTWELYDLQTDSDEMNNLYDNPEYIDIIRELKAELKRLQIRYDDPIREQFPL